MAMTMTSAAPQNYVFTPDQLNRLLYNTIAMFIEYRDVHGRTEDQAKFCAVNEMFEGLDAERYLVEQGLMVEPTLQVLSKEQKP